MSQANSTLISISEAYRYCEKLVKNDNDKWPIEIVMISKEHKKYLYMIWAFARIADDYADEGVMEWSHPL